MADRGAGGGVAGAALSGEGDWRCLELLARLPLLPASALRPLLGVAGQAAAYERLDRLVAAGLAAAVRAALVPGKPARLFHPTDRGLAALAARRGVAPGELARELRLRRRDLLALLPGLPARLALYELLGALAAAGPGRPELAAWRCPEAAGRGRGARGKAGRLRLPAYAALTWADAGAAEFWLLPDLGTAPLRAWRWALGRWREHGGRLAAAGRRVPTLVVGAPTRERAAAWSAALAAAGTGSGGWDAAPPSYVAVAGRGEEGLATAVRRALVPGAGGLPAAGRRAGESCAAPGRAPRIIGPPLAAGYRGRGASAPARSTRLADLGALALALSPSDWRLLDLLGCHPFLSAADLGAVLDWGRWWVGERRDALVARGLVRLVGAAEPGAGALGEGAAECTAAGLALVAARQGLPLARAVALNGLAGGGPEAPVGARARLLQHPAHTRGADAFFAGLCRAARAAGDGELLAWRPAAACTHGRARPDGYGRFRSGGRAHDFFLEYDRGTMSIGACRRKFAAYARDHEQGRFARAYGRCPAILVVTTADTGERRLARALGALAGSWVAPPLALLTTEARLAADERGALGPVWRAADSAARRHWFAPDRTDLGPQAP